ncbi:MAG: hypothetical protein IH612_08450 [Desulfofustis sp.]|nr:hypothetical protein [Desulfofustis sp.]
MELFVSQYPALILGFIALIVSAMLGLLGVLGWFGRRLLSDLLEAIKQLKESITLHTGDIGTLKDRMTATETICRMQRAYCPLPGRRTSDYEPVTGFPKPLRPEGEKATSQSQN